MRLLGRQAAIGTAILLLSASAQAKHSHLEALERRHSHHHQLHQKAQSSPRAAEENTLKRSAQCVFPTDAGLVPVTPDSQNAGWAMSPNQPCLPGNYCPYACPPGQLMAQWDPAATSYSYPLSMNGGLYCDNTGAISKPFPNKPYCYEGKNTVEAKNNCGKEVAFCQTVLPGNEAMLIPNVVSADVVLAVPGTEYWIGSAAHYYVNPPGYTTDQACIWGDGSLPIGNWSPYVAGANTDANGNTFVKIAWNPIYTGSSFASELPTWGLKIDCEESGCNGLPCSIDPSVNAVNGVTSADQATGAGGGNFCVVTVPSGNKAHIVVFDAGDSSAPDGPDSSSSPSSSSYVAATSSPPSSTSSTSSSSTSSSSTSKYSSKATTSESHAAYTNAPHVLFENATTTSNTSTAIKASSTSSSHVTSSSTNTTASTSTTAVAKNAASSSLATTGTVGFAAIIAIIFSYIL